MKSRFKWFGLLLPLLVLFALFFASFPENALAVAPSIAAGWSHTP